MDPNAALAEIRAEIADIESAGNDIEYRGAHKLADLVQSLDEWIAKGGFLPDAWQTD